MSVSQILKYKGALAFSGGGDLIAVGTKEYTADAEKSGLLTADYLPMLCNSFTSEFARIGLKDLQRDPITGKSVYHGNGTAVIENAGTSQRPLETSAKKLLDTALVYLSHENYGKSLSQLTVMIPLIEYGDANGYKLIPRRMCDEQAQKQEDARVHERLKDFKRRIRRDLKAIQNIRYQGKERKPRHIISAFDIIREGRASFIKVVFDRDMADDLASGYMFQFPTALLRLDNRNVNAYAIGRKIAEHKSFDQNIAAGTANTLKVGTLLRSAPEIQTYDDFRRKKRRDWKLRIKHPLEKALNANAAVGFIIQWRYRNPKTGQQYSPDEAEALRWTDYNRLDVDFELLPNLKQEERRRKKSEHSDADYSAKNREEPGGRKARK